MELINLAGCEVKKKPCLFIFKPSDFRCIINNGFAATAAKQNGAINVWQDDESNIRCEAMRNYMVLDTQIFDNDKDVESWVKKWLKAIK